MLTLPGTGEIPVDSPPKGTLHVDQLVDHGNNTVTRIHRETAYAVVGKVELPGLLSGRGVLTLSANEIGGAFEGQIGQTVIPIAGSPTPGDPPSMSYNYRIDLPAATFPEVAKEYFLTLVFAYVTGAGGHTDIIGSYDLGTVLVV